MSILRSVSRWPRRRVATAYGTNSVARPRAGAENSPCNTSKYMGPDARTVDRKSTRLNSSHSQISYAVFCLKKKKNQAVATSQEAVQNHNDPQLRDENAHNDKSVHGVLNPTYQDGLRCVAVQRDIEAEREKRDEIDAGKSYCSRRFGGETCDDKSAQIYASFDKYFFFF